VDVLDTIDSRYTMKNMDGAYMVAYTIPTPICNLDKKGDLGCDHNSEHRLTKICFHVMVFSPRLGKL
jgi:hypothetical protein